jgi:glycosyltransferase involved in cell wall biosynthesis
VSFARGRRVHLERQARAVARLDPPACDYVLVSLDAEPHAPPGARVLHRPADPPLPLAAARNAAIAAVDADLVVCLDADCLPEPPLLGRLVAAARAMSAPRLLAGPVGRLPPLPAERTEPTAADLEVSRAAAALGGRPVLPDGAIEPEPRMERFWSLAFAVEPRTHARIGGFDEGYTGYGAEDTDYAFSARAAGVGLSWVGGAWAHHQHHPVSVPPVEHLDDIVRNARRFRARWGRWPMQGWLREFAARGLVEWDGPEALGLALAAPRDGGRPAAATPA